MVLTFYSWYVIPEPDQYNDFLKPGLTRHFYSKWWTQTGIWRLSPHCFVVEPAIWFVFSFVWTLRFGRFRNVLLPKGSCRFYSIIYFSNEIWYISWAKVGFDLSSNRLFTSFDYEQNKGRWISNTFHQEYLTHNVNLVILSYYCTP